MFTKPVHIDTWQQRVFIEYNCYYFVINITIKCSQNHHFILLKVRISLCCVHTNLIISLISSTTLSKLLHSFSSPSNVFSIMRDSNNNCLNSSWAITICLVFLYDVLHWYHHSKVKFVRLCLIKKSHSFDHSNWVLCCVYLHCATIFQWSHSECSFWNQFIYCTDSWHGLEFDH